MDEYQPLKQALEGKVEALKSGQNIILEGADLFTDTGYIQYPKFVFYDQRLSDVVRSCYAVILHYAFNQNRTIPGQSEVAAFWGVHRNTVGRSMRRLEELGYISTIRRHAGLKDIICIHYTVSGMYAGEDAPVPIAFDPGKLGVRLTDPKSVDFRSKHGWIEVPAILYNGEAFSGLNDSDRSVYVVLLDYAFGKDTCFPKQDTIGSRLGKQPRTIEDNIAKLKRAGLIEAVRRRDTLANQYSLNLRVNKKRSA